MNIFLCSTEGWTSTKQQTSKRCVVVFFLKEMSTSGWMDGVEANVNDPGQDEGDPTLAQQFVAESPVLSQDPPVSILVHQGEALTGVQSEQGGHSQTQQEEEEQAEVEALPHQGGLVQHLTLTVLQQGAKLVVVVVVGQDAGERVHD